MGKRLFYLSCLILVGIAVVIGVACGGTQQAGSKSLDQLIDEEIKKNAKNAEPLTPEEKADELQKRIELKKSIIELRAKEVAEEQAEAIRSVTEEKVSVERNY